MKGVVITADLDVSIQDFGEPLYQTVGAAVGGYIEHVKPMGLKPPFCMIVNEEGLLRGLPINKIGCDLYGTQLHGHPIVGTAVIMKDGFRDGEPDIIGLTDAEADNIYHIFNDMTESTKSAMRAVRKEK